MRTLSGVFSIVMLMPALLAQSRDVVLLKNWPAPLYWQPSPVEAEEATFKTERASPRVAAPVNPLVFVGMTPCRLVDTRSSQPFTGAFGPPSLVGGASRTFPIQSSSTCTIPAIAQAYSFNVTVVPPGPLGFLTMYPTGQSLPLASTLNSLQGYIVSNAAVVAAGTAGSVDVYVSNNTDVVIDINGYYVAAGSGSTVYTISFDKNATLLKRNSVDISVVKGGTGAYLVYLPSDEFICTASFGPPTPAYTYISVDNSANPVIVRSRIFISGVGGGSGDIDEPFNVVCAR